MAELNPVQKVKERFPEKIRELWERSPKRIYITAGKDDVKDMVKFLFEDLGARFIIMSALDTRQGIEILYHFSFDTLGKIVSIRTLVPMPFPEIESVSLIIPGAEYIEREVHDILGVNFRNHPNLKRFLLGDDWPEGEYPFRKEHKGQFPYRTEEEQDIYRKNIRKKGEA
jgi:Ni,Fe-hydrogenase III component G